MKEKAQDTEKLSSGGLGFLMEKLQHLVRSACLLCRVSRGRGYRTQRYFAQIRRQSLWCADEQEMGLANLSSRLFGRGAVCRL